MNDRQPGRHLPGLPHGLQVLLDAPKGPQRGGLPQVRSSGRCLGVGLGPGLPGLGVGGENRGPLWISRGTGRGGLPGAGSRAGVGGRGLGAVGAAAGQ
ncbi:hypothetical protein EHS43_02540 [Streptomyces sp. RP5T]|nr:hypothetical protein EHS43_02540 [Streptomyces sp. RP5T]